ncbi:MAG: hypothetical protein PHH70_03860 [Candidatus Gracilibacteria bacterium]|nr:hypothetical protein [Candidatus Gracilibacteria bacterium]
MFSCLGIAATATVPANRLDVFDTFSSSDWTRATASYAPNSIYILKSTGNVTFGLTLQMFELGVVGSTKRFVLDDLAFAGISQARISDKMNPNKGQCVDFVKTMIGSVLSTSSWHAGTKLSTIPSNQLADTVPRGTVIAYFGPNATSSTTYDIAGKHVAVVLNFTFDSATMQPTGMTVMDQNFLLFDLKIGGLNKGQSPQSISRHFLNWNGADVSGGGNYHIVDIRGIHQNTYT